MEETNSVLEVGLQVFIESVYDNKHIKHKTKVLGWHTTNFIMITLPMINGAAVRWEMGTPCIIKFLSEGNVYAFQTNLLKVVYQPEPLLFLKYPNEIENVTIRKFDRIQTFIICEIYTLKDEVTVIQMDNDDDATAESDPNHAILLDLSSGGGLINITDVKNEEIVQLYALVGLDFTLPDGTKIRGLVAEIRNIREDMGKKLAGIKFVDKNLTALGAIKDFFDKHIKA